MPPSARNQHQARTAVTPSDAAAADNSESRETPSQLIDARIEELSGWRGETLANVRRLIKRADPHVAEEWKWRVPVWSHGGLICTGEAYKKAVKLTFPKGARLKDPTRLFNASLEGHARRAIDLREGDRLDEAAFEALIREAVASNASAARRTTSTRATAG